MTAHEPNRPDWIMDYLREKPSATIRELMDAVGLASTSAVHHWLRRLERQGKLERSLCHECGHDRWRVVALKEDRDGRRSIDREYQWSFMRYVHNVAWSYLFHGRRYGTREGYFNWAFWRLSTNLAVKIERNYPCGCWESWVLWDVGRNRIRLLSLGNHDLEAEEFRRERRVA